MNDMAQTQMHVSSGTRARSQTPTGTAVSPRKSGRSPWFTVTLTAWLLFLSVIVWATVMQLHHERQFRLAKGTETPGSSLAESVLAERVEGMAARLQTETTRLREATETELASVQQSLEEKTSAVTEQLTGQAVEMGKELATLRGEIKALEARLDNERQTVITSSRVEPTQPQPVRQPLPSIKPPFQVIGVEQRGVERFLTVMRQGSQTVADIQLLRVGTRFGAWLLEAIEEDQAIFRIEDAIVRVPIPRFPILSGSGR